MELENTLTKEWTAFDGNYEKEMQDVQLHDGTIIKMCWPNAGKFLCCTSSTKKEFSCKEVAFVRLAYDTALFAVNQN